MLESILNRPRNSPHHSAVQKPSPRGEGAPVRTLGRMRGRSIGPTGREKEGIEATGPSFYKERLGTGSPPHPSPCLLYTSTRRQGYPPTLREIGQAVGVRSPSTVKYHRDNLRQAGLIQWDGGKTRSLSLPTRPDAPPDQVPLVGHVAAVAPSLAEEHVEDYVPFPTGGHPEDYFALRVRGESMLGAGIHPGDLVVVHCQREAVNGEIVVALFDDEATAVSYTHLPCLDVCILGGEPTPPAFSHDSGTTPEPGKNMVSYFPPQCKKRPVT